MVAEYATEILPKGKIDLLLEIISDTQKSERNEVIEDWIVRFGKTNPIFEECGEEDKVKVLLLTKNQTGEYWENLYLVGDSFGWDKPQHEMKEIDGTRWYLTQFERPCGSRLHYMFAPNDIGGKITEENRETRTRNWLLDDRNNLTKEEGDFVHSVMELPGFENNLNKDTTIDNFSEIYLRNKIEGHREAQLKLITPNDNQNEEDIDKLLIVHDGDICIDLMEMDKILQAGVNEGRWPSMALLTLNTPNSEKEYGGRYGYPDYFADTIIPSAQHHLGQSFESEDVILAGTGLGAWAAFNVMISRPDAIKNIISQSAPLWWPEDDRYRCIKEIKEREKLDVNKIYLDAGFFGERSDQTSTFESNQKMAEALNIAGYEFMARQYKMGDQSHSWSWAFPAAMDYIINDEKNYGPNPVARELEY